MHSNFPKIMHVTTNIYMIVRSFELLMWMQDNRGSVSHVTLWKNHIVDIAIMTLMIMITT